VVETAGSISIKGIMETYHVEDSKDARRFLGSLSKLGLSAEDYKMIFSSRQDAIKTSNGGILRKTVDRGRDLECDICTCAFDGERYRIVGRDGVGYYVAVAVGE
jgi:hypothetical protein